MHAPTASASRMQRKTPLADRSPFAPPWLVSEGPCLTDKEDSLAILDNDGAHVGAQDMTEPPGDHFGFAPDDDAPIAYMARTREYYQAIGYTTPYRWAHYVDAPLQPLKKPLPQSRVAIVTTAAPFHPLKGDQGPGANYNGGAKFYSGYDGDTS